jgi:hypothetical protein
LALGLISRQCDAAFTEKDVPERAISHDETFAHLSPAKPFFSHRNLSTLEASGWDFFKGEWAQGK